MATIVLTGGGTAGHVTPNIALLPELRKAGYDIYYIGSKDGIERKLMLDQGVPYAGVSTGKLRRYFDLQNFTDPFKVLTGIKQSTSVLNKIKPDVVFSKGGFVSVPVVRAAYSLGIPCIIHESDMTPGLANKLCIPCARHVCVNFPETVPYIKDSKGVVTGSPIRQELFEGSKEAGVKFCGFKEEKPVLMVMGGSQGAVAINEGIRSILSILTDKFNVIHLCGKGNLSREHSRVEGYAQFEYIGKELPDLFAAADIVVSRAGANSICELLALKKPALLIPLSRKSSRGDQILNAESFKKQGFAHVLEEENITDEVLFASIKNLYNEKDKLIEKMERSNQSDAIEKIMSLINVAARIHQKNK